jgi:hypothetical protein
MDKATEMQCSKVSASSWGLCHPEPFSWTYLPEFSPIRPLSGLWLNEIQTAGAVLQM